MKTRMKEDNKARLHLADVIYCTGATLTRTRLDKEVERGQFTAGIGNTATSYYNTRKCTL